MIESIECNRFFLFLQEQQLGSMETEVRNMQIELANVQRVRQQLEQQRKLLKCTAPCAPCACSPPPTSTCVTPTPGLPLTSISKVPAVSGVPLAQVLTQLVFYTVYIVFYPKFSKAILFKYEFLYTYLFSIFIIFLQLMCFPINS